MIQKLYLSISFLFAGLYAIAQVTCNADIPIIVNDTATICGYDLIPDFIIERGKNSNHIHTYEYRIYSFDLNSVPYNISAGNSMIETVDSLSSKFNPSAYATFTKSYISYPFWIAEFDITDQCYGKAIKTILKINQPQPPTINTPPSLCEKKSKSISLTATASGVASGSSILWYNGNETRVMTAVDSSKILYIGKTFTILGIDTLPVGFYNYVVSTVSKGCQSEKKNIILEVYPNPKPPVLIANSSCSELHFNALTANGDFNNIIKWYSDLNAINLLANGIKYTPTIFTAPNSGLTQFYASQTDTYGCESALAKVDYTVIPSPGVKVNGPTSIAANLTKITFNIVPENSNDIFLWNISNYRVIYSIAAHNDLIRQIDFTGNVIPDTLVVSEDNGTCIGYDTLFINAKQTYSPIVLISSLKLYPNPSSHYLHILAKSEFSGIETLKIYNIIGALVYKKELESVREVDETIFVDTFPIGIYSVVIETDKGYQSELVYVER
jgi:hypothetical protein